MQKTSKGAGDVAKAVVEWHGAADTMNLLIIANPMTDVEGVVNQVVVGQGDALGIARCSRCELNIAGIVHPDLMGEVLHHLGRP